VNRIDRLFSTVLLLHGRRRVRGADLASELGVSLRTVYRDIAALNEAGVPVVSLPGEGYELMEGYFLPPLRFTPSEASSLVLGARLLQAQATGSVADGVQSAVAKIKASLGVAVRERLEAATEAIAFPRLDPSFDLEQPKVEALQQAIRLRRVVRLRYHGLALDAVTERYVEPHRLDYANSAWYLTAFCRLRGAPREFRLTRIEDIELTDETYQPRKDLEAPERYSPTGDVEVTIRVAAPTARWVRERQHYALVEERDVLGEAAIEFTYRVNTLPEIAPWLRGWGPSVEVLAPAALRALLRREAEEVAQILT
jgi:predicted DNA-binding transcriptional regulator YafY